MTDYNTIAENLKSTVVDSYISEKKTARVKQDMLTS